MSAVSRWPSLEDLAATWPIYVEAYGDDAGPEMLSTLLGNGWDRHDAVATVAALVTGGR